MAPKSRFVGVRLEPEQQRKLIVLSLAAGEPGNMSAALRFLVDNAPAPDVGHQVSEAAGKQPSGEVIHA